MATMVNRGAGTPMGRGRPGAARASRLPLTLADLLTAIQDVVGPDNDGLVVTTVRHLLRSGQLMVRGTGTRRCPPPRQEQGWSHDPIACSSAGVTISAAQKGYPALFSDGLSAAPA